MATSQRCTPSSSTLSNSALTFSLPVRTLRLALLRLNSASSATISVNGSDSEVVVCGQSCQIRPVHRDEDDRTLGLVLKSGATTLTYTNDSGSEE